MDIFLHVFFISLLSGVVAGISISPGVVLYLHDIVLCIGFVFFGVFAIRKRKFTIPRLWKPILFFLIAAITSLAVNSSIFPFTSLVIGSLYLWRWLLYVSLYGVLIQGFVSAKDILERLFLFGCAFGCIGLVQFILYPNLRFLLYLGWDPHYYRLFSTLLDPNFAGIVLVLSTLLGYHLYLKEKKTWHLVALGVLISCVYLTYSRSSYLAMATGALVYGIAQKKWNVLALLAVFLFLIVFIPRPGGNTLRLWREDSTYSRFSNWKESSALFLESPVFGHGFNMLRAIQTPTGPTPSSFVSHAAAGVDSSILFLLVTSGVFGLFTYAYLLYSAYIPRGKSKDLVSIRQLYISSIASVVVHSFFVNSLFYPWVMLWLWILVAAMEITYDR